MASVPSLLAGAAGGSNLGGAVYGTVLVIAVLGAWYADDTAEVGDALLSLLSTVAVFWLAHAYAHVFAAGLQPGETTTGRIRPAIVHDWPIAQAAILPSLVMLAGVLGLVDGRQAMLAGLGAAVLSLFLFGLAMARAGGRTWPQAALTSAVLGCLGLGIAVLEVMLD